MTATDLVAALTPVVEALETLDVPYYLAGSIASSAHGIARASLDADVVADVQARHVDGLARCLTGAYYIPLDTMRLAVSEQRSFNLIHLTTMFKIDVFVQKGRPYDRVAAARAQRQVIDGLSESPRFLVASAEDTVLAKLEWFRLGGETSERQWWDIVGVLRVAATDRSYLHRWALALGVADLLDRALEQATE
jgi:hypothetical protein